MRLLDLPPELLEAILFFLPLTQLITLVSPTCRRLRQLLRSDSFWKRRYAALVSATPPSIEQGGPSVWQRGCVEAQFARRLGHNTITPTTLRGSTRAHTVSFIAYSFKMIHIVLSICTVGPTGGVDCVHLMFPEAHGAVGLVAAGCRDSSIYLWRRRGQDSGPRSMRGNIVYRLEGHMVRREKKGLIMPRCELENAVKLIFMGQFSGLGLGE